MNSQKTVRRILLGLIAVSLIGGTFLLIRQLNASVDSYSAAGKYSSRAGWDLAGARKSQSQQHAAHSQLLAGYGLAGLSYGVAVILGVVYFFLPKSTKDLTTQDQKTTE
jgi:hypothetical protein